MSTSYCSSCEPLLERMKEKMTHIEQLRREINIGEENQTSLTAKYQNLEKENLRTEKHKGFLSREVIHLKEENDKLKKLLQEKHEECQENERLLDVIHKDRDECIDEKMKASKFYRSEMTRLNEDNKALREEYKELKMKFEEKCLQNLVPDAIQNLELKKDEKYGAVLEKTQGNLAKVGNKFSEDESSRFCEELQKTSQQIDIIKEHLSKLELTVQQYNQKIEKFGEDISMFEMEFDEKSASENELPIENGKEEDEGSICYCNQKHYTLEQLIACPVLERRINEELEKCDESVKKEEDELVDEEVNDEQREEIEEDCVEEANQLEEDESEEVTSFEIIENSSEN